VEKRRKKDTTKGESVRRGGGLGCFDHNPCRRKEVSRFYLNLNLGGTSRRKKKRKKKVRVVVHPAVVTSTPTVASKEGIRGKLRERKEKRRGEAP